MGIIIVSILVLIVAIMLALYFTGRLQALFYGVTGSAQYMVTLNSLSENEFKLSIKNIGSVAIVRADIKILDGITRTQIWSATINFQNSRIPVKQGQTAVIDCAVGYGCVVTVSGYSNSISLSSNWPPSQFIAGRPYIISVKLYFANGQQKTWTTEITATS